MSLGADPDWVVVRAAAGPPLLAGTSDCSVHRDEAGRVAVRARIGGAHVVARSPVPVPATIEIHGALIHHQHPITRPVDGSATWGHVRRLQLVSTPSGGWPRDDDGSGRPYRLTPVQHVARSVLWAEPLGGWRLSSVLVDLEVPDDQGRLAAAGVARYRRERGLDAPG
ncbi:hypothetical protein JL107_14320 [Nakamurella flavida]|uniref:Uncharacterized protein n=1 Tax=Nakamurella flavida TaxID=363630 RepID=A0A938YQZ3_9ACTN|nr:hypothetical protein [Nakamurella flavida]MBM9477623.1 hypothetical protein [Nakamurella flavida]